MLTLQSYNTKEYWQTTRLAKYSTKGVVRCVEPQETIRRCSAVLEQAGITTVSEVTDLDRVGIPNFMSVRPRDTNPGISYYNGKGTTKSDAHAGALMEAIERHAGETCEFEVITGSFNELKRSWTCVKPEEIVVPPLREYSDDLRLEWVAGYDLLNAKETLVPLNAVICPYVPQNGASALFYASTNGLASGNTRMEALCHALCEIIERDAEAIAVARAQIGPAARSVLGSGPVALDAPRRISLDGLAKRAQPLIMRLQRAGLRVYLRDFTSTCGIATIDCTIVEKAIDGTDAAYGGCGSHPDARVALLRAITEAAQSRLTVIQGGREDLDQIIKHRDGTNLDEIYEHGEWISFSDIPTYESNYIDEDVELLLDRLPKYGINQLVAFDMTHPNVGIPVVRVVLPLAETWTVFHLHTGRGTFGPRIAREL